MDLATATDLGQWAERRDAQAQLPQLVRRLIIATADGLSRLSVRAGEGVTLPGWDGIVEAARASAFVPAGLSVWEMGVGEPLSKANRDYQTRTEDPGEASPSETTFVFVTPHRWSRKSDWSAERTREGPWLRVLAYDGDDLETWLESAPAVHAWISWLIGKDPYEVEGLETWWQAWSGATRPPFPPTLVLSGRKRKVDELRASLGGEAGTFSVAADSQSEALAFIAGAVLTQDDPSLIERCLIVRSPQAWRRIAVASSPLVLIPTFDQPTIAPAIQSGHHVVIPLGRELTSVRGIKLGRLRRAGIEVALREAGLAPARASSLATLGRRSLLSLRRTLAANPDTEIPAWARPENAPDILPAVLAGSWDDNSEGDRQVLAAIAGRPYDEVVRALTRWLNASDPPVRRIADVWMIAAKADSWLLTARALTSDSAARFRQVATEVLGADDPSLDLPRDQRIMAGLLGRRRRHSGHVYRGIADTLALIAATAEDIQLAGDRRGDTEASIIVRELLQSANEDSSGRRWETLAAALPLVAEAAPTEFLRAVEEGSRDANGPILHLFQDTDRASYYSSSSPHTQLLWALETIAWSPPLLPRAALGLAILARLEPGGHTLNRPFDSLRDILLLWSPGTAASLDERIQVVDLVRRHEPDVAWPLLLRLIPAGSESVTPTSAPEYRDWKPESADVFVADVMRAATQLVERAIVDAGTEGGRWAELLERVASTKLPIGNIAIEGLERLGAQAFDTANGVIVYRALKHLVNQHTQFRDAEWAMPADTLERFSSLISTFEPTAPSARHGWLFEQGALDAFVAEDRQQRLRDLDTEQDLALRAILSEEGLNGLFDWATTLGHAQFSGAQIGTALARVHHDPGQLLAFLSSPRDSDRIIVLQYVASMTSVRGLDWAAEMFTRHSTAWSPETKVLFLRALPARPEVWTFVESLGAEVDLLYWRNAHPYSLPDQGDSARVAAEKLLGAGQPGPALHVLSQILRHEPGRVPLELVASSLEALPSTPTAIDSSLADVIGAHLERLDKAGFERERLARLEWLYLPLFRFGKRSFGVLHHALADDPGFFVDVVSLAFRAHSEEPRELTPTERSQTESANELLDSWRIVPGTRTDGTLDGAALASWVDDARRRLANVDRLEIGDEVIGRVLRYGPRPAAPTEEDETAPVEVTVGSVPEPDWPAIPIRNVLEACRSEHIEAGFQVELFNSRGVTTRALTEGGRQERELGARYRRYAASSGMSWPRTAAMLARIAEMYEREAQRHDDNADFTEDTWR